MPDISNQMSYIQQLQDVRNPNSPMGALDRLGSSIGNAWQGYQGRTDEQDATKYFMENPTSPETIQTFAASHPQMPLMDVYRYAGAIATQKKAQKMKDRIKTLQDSLAGGAEMNEKLLPTLFKDMAPDELMEFQKILTGAQQVGLNFKSLKEKDRFKPIGAQGLYDTETKGIIGQPAEKTTLAVQADRAVKILMTKTNPNTGETYTEDEAYIKIHHRPPTPKAEKDIELYKGTGRNIQSIKVPESKKVEYEGQGWSGVRPLFAPEVDPDSKSKRIPYRDTVTGAVNYYDVNNPKDRETLQKYGAQLQAVAENPLAPVMRESLTTSTSTKSTYKTADEVKAAYESKKITKEKALEILRKDFGM